MAETLQLGPAGHLHDGKKRRDCLTLAAAAGAGIGAWVPPGRFVTATTIRIG